MKEIAIIDIETTDLKPEFGLIVEIAAVKLNLESGEITTLFDKIVKEKGFVTKAHCHSWVFQHSDLDPYSVENSEYLETYKDELQEIFSKYPITAYNKQFDINYLESRYFKFKELLSCPMLLLTPIMKLPGYYDYKWPSFQEARDYYFPDTDYKEKHRAHDDAYHEAELIKTLYDKGIFRC